MFLYINGFGKRYSVNELGHIMSNKFNRERILKFSNYNGYNTISLEGKRYYIHRLVAMMFLGDWDNKLRVNHKNGIKNDNRVDNLEMITHSQCIKQAISSGLYVPFKKLTNNEVIEIKEILASGLYTQTYIASLYGVHGSLISLLNSNKRR